MSLELCSNISYCSWLCYHNHYRKWNIHDLKVSVAPSNRKCQCVLLKREHQQKCNLTIHMVILTNSPTIMLFKELIKRCSQFAGHPLVAYFLFYECRLTFSNQWSNADIRYYNTVWKIMFSRHYVTISENTLRYIKENVDW